MATKSKSPEREVTILDDREVTTYPKLNVPLKQHVVTYQADTLPPRVLFIPAEGYSEKVLKDAIRADLAAMEKAKPKTITI